MQDRREFIKGACIACVGIAGLGIVLTELESCKTADNTTIRYTLKDVTVPMKQLDGKDYLLLKSPSLEYDILLAKKEDGGYEAIKMICSHQHNPLVISGNTLYCPAHGSDFDFSGNVLTGPATGVLKKFAVTNEKNALIIRLS